MAFTKLIPFILLGLGLIVLQQVYNAIYHTFFSPLRNIPGPWYASITWLPKHYQTIIQRGQSRWTHAMHQKYGEYVRVGPEEVLISDVAAFREIHKMGTRFYKTDVYRFLNPTPPGEPPYGLFQEIDPSKHATMRRMLANGFSLSHLRTSWESTVHERVGAVVEGMRREAASNGGEIDIYKWWPLFTGDVISTLMFGECPHRIERGEDDEMIEAFKLQNAGNGFAYTFPYIYHVLKWLPISALRKAWGGNPVAIARAQAALKNSKGSSEKRNIFAQVLNKHDDNTLAMSDEEIVMNAAVLIFAGTDTTATTLTYLVWQVLKNAVLQRELEEELGQLEPSYTDEMVGRLPILSAVIRETLRLHGAAPGPLPRYVPKEGATFGPYYFPPGTTVATQAWTLHRDPNVFDRPEEFDPTRWLGNLASKEEVKARWAPYGAGSRICVGLHLADMELRLATTAFFRAFRGAKLSASTTEESMVMDNVALIEPHGHACKIVLNVD